MRRLLPTLIIAGCLTGRATVDTNAASLMESDVDAFDLGWAVYTQGATDLPIATAYFTNTSDEVLQVVETRVDGEGAIMVSLVSRPWPGQRIQPGDRVPLEIAVTHVMNHWEHGPHSSELVFQVAVYIPDTGCGSSSIGPSHTYVLPISVELDCDLDGDGVESLTCKGDDCDDEDARAYGGAEEICDRVDNNCDGRVDEGC